MRKAFERFLEVAGTLGFWTVNVFWFAAGSFFYATFPDTREDTPWLNDMLIKALLLIVLLPVYWTMILDLSKDLTELINRFLNKQKR